MWSLYPKHLNNILTLWWNLSLGFRVCIHYLSWWSSYNLVNISYVSAAFIKMFSPNVLKQLWRHRENNTVFNLRWKWLLLRPRYLITRGVFTLNVEFFSVHIIISYHASFICSFSTMSSCWILLLPYVQH